MDNIVFIPAFILIAAFILMEIQIWLTDKKIKYIEILLQQSERTSDLHYMYIRLIEAKMEGDTEQQKAIKDQFDKYCNDNDVYAIVHGIADEDLDKEDK